MSSHVCSEAVRARDPNLIRSPEVEAWFATTKPPAEVAIQRVREIILKADPRITEYVKHGNLHFGFGGDMVSLVQHRRKDVNLMFNRGARIPGAFPHLEGSGPSARFMRLADLAAVEARADELAAVAVAWCRLVAP